MKYIVVGPTIVNDIEFEDGSLSKGHIGGSVFCLAGIKLWSDDCLYVSNVGPDFADYYGEWMDANGCSYDGLNTILPHTQYTLLRYGKYGLHSEESVYGSQEEALVEVLDKPDAALIASHCDNGTKGIYIEASETDFFWDDIDLIRQKGNISIMWEIPTSAAMQSERRDRVLATIQNAGLYSINLPEAQSLFQASDENTAIAAILRYGIPCYFRVGAKGSYMLCNNERHFAPSITVGPVVDATGCGNCSTAAALYGFCECLSPAKVAATGNISAAYNLLQYGPYPKVDSETRKHVQRLLEKF